MDKPLKVLIVAPNASSEFGGEAFLPLKYFQILRRRKHPVILIAHSRNRANLQDAFPEDQEAIHYVEDTRAHWATWRAGRLFPEPLRSAVFGTVLNLVNEAFQSRLIRRLVQEGKVDVIHQPIPVSPKAPSSVYGFGVPVVIGPMNGGMTFPPGYEDYESTLARRFVAASRRLAVALNRMVPGKRKAAALLVANSRTRDALPVRHPNVINLVENGVDLSVWSAGRDARPTRRAGDPFRMVFMGRLVAWKAVDITLQALHLVRSTGRNVTLDILGDGELRGELEKQARDSGLDGAVRFLGFRPQRECAEYLLGSDALILNSLYECGGAVVLEAMSLGLPVIAADWGGPADYIDETCGLLVSPVPRHDFAARLSGAIARLADDPDLASQLGNAGSRRVVEQFDWETKVDKVLAIHLAAVRPGGQPGRAPRSPTEKTR